MLLFDMLNMTPFYVEKRMSQLSCVPNNPMFCPNAPHTGVHHWDTFFRLIKLEISPNVFKIHMYERA